MIGAATYSPTPYRYEPAIRSMNQAQTAVANPSVENTSASDQSKAVRANPVPGIKSAAGIPEYPTIYRAEFQQNISRKTDHTSEPSQIGMSKSGKKEAAQKTGATECKTCSERKYQDGSDDPGVSFKAPTHIAPGNAAAAVSAHEQEHVVREQSEAQLESREIISQSVQIYTAICPECGRTYVAGGKTTTTTASVPKREQNQAAVTGQQFDAYA